MASRVPTTHNPRALDPDPRPRDITRPKSSSTCAPVFCSVRYLIALLALVPPPKWATSASIAGACPSRRRGLQPRPCRRVSRARAAAGHGARARPSRARASPPLYRARRPPRAARRLADILNLFRPNEPLPYLPPAREPTEPAPSALCGVAPFASAFETGPAPPVQHSETPEERRAKRRADRAARHQDQLDGLVAGWDPKRNPAATADAYKTLFVARLAYETTERKLQKEFEAFGPIVSVRLVKDQAGQSRGYAFIEYKDGEDLKRAYRRGDGLRIDGRRVLVDVERARTVRGAWLGGMRGVASARWRTPIARACPPPPPLPPCVAPRSC